MKNEIVVIGGGAAGFFAAITCAEKYPDYSVTILEKSSSLLQKVKISGGGRCNITNACFDPEELVKNYPRGEKQLLGPFTRFNTSNTIEWFESRGVQLKTEPDKRIFPVTDSSQTVIDCFLNEAERLRVRVRLRTGVEKLEFGKDKWQIETNTGESIAANFVIITTGSSSGMWSILEKLGHKIVPPVPSLFTFNINDKRIKGLEGLSVSSAQISILNLTRSRLSATGPLLITHWGISGPVVLRLSAWGARELAVVNHKFDIELNWLNKTSAEIKELLKYFKQNNPKKNIIANPLFNIPKRLWGRLAQNVSIKATENFADLSNKQMEEFTRSLCASKFSVTGKSTYKDEFVTAGGLELKEVDFKTMQSKKFRGLYFAGEVLDIDAITGGFNFQAAWTTGWIAGTSV